MKVDADLVIRVLGLLEVHAGTEADRDARAVMHDGGILAGTRQPAVQRQRSFENEL